MHPDMMFELTKFRMEELHKEAAQHRRLAKRRSGDVPSRRASNLGSRLGFGAFRSKAA